MNTNVTPTLADLPWRVTAVAPGTGDRWSTCTQRYGTYLEALAQAKRLAWEAQPARGVIRYVETVRHPVDGYLVADDAGELYSLILVWCPRPGARETNGVDDVAAG